MSRRSAMVLLACLAILHPGCAAQEATDKENRSSAEVVVRALEEFKTDRGAYPQRLDALVPDYLSDKSDIFWTSRAGTERNKPFNYDCRDEGQGFVLRFPEAGLGPFWSDAAFEYESSIGEWRYVTY